MDVVGFAKVESCTIAMSLDGCESSQKLDDHAFLYVEFTSRELFQEFHEKSGGM